MKVELQSSKRSFHNFREECVFTFSRDAKSSSKEMWKKIVFLKDSQLSKQKLRSLKCDQVDRHTIFLLPVSIVHNFPLDSVNTVMLFTVSIYIYILPPGIFYPIVSNFLPEISSFLNQHPFLSSNRMNLVWSVSNTFSTAWKL